MKRIYLDNNATTEIDPAVFTAMQEELLLGPANPSSLHYFGQEAKKRLSKARQTLASYLKVKSSEILFTSGGTESINLILRGYAQHHPGCHILSSSIEHAAVYNTLKQLEKSGCAVTFLSPDETGSIPLEKIEQAVRPNTKMIALSAANSETGVKNDIAAIAALAQQKRLFFFCDAVALLGKEPLLLPKGLGAMAFSGHKIHAPKGVGFAYLDAAFRIDPILTGGGQEFGLRSGTENLPAIIGLAKAVELLAELLPAASQQMERARNRLETELATIFPSLIIHGRGERLSNTSLISFPSYSGEDLLISLDMAGVAVSHGSACASGALEPSRVLLNMGVSQSLARSAIRFSLSRKTTESEIEQTLLRISNLLAPHQK